MGERIDALMAQALLELRPEADSALSVATVVHSIANDMSECRLLTQAIVSHFKCGPTTHTMVLDWIQDIYQREAHARTVEEL